MQRSSSANHEWPRSLNSHLASNIWVDRECNSLKSEWSLQSVVPPPPPPQLDSLRKCNCMILILAVSVVLVTPQKLQMWGGNTAVWNHLVAEAAKELYSSQWCRNSPHLADLLCLLALSQSSVIAILKLFWKGFPKGPWNYLLLLSLSFIVLLE